MRPTTLSSPDVDPPNWTATKIRESVKNLQRIAIAHCRAEAMRINAQPEDLIDSLALSLMRRCIERRATWTPSPTPSAQS